MAGDARYMSAFLFHIFYHHASGAYDRAVSDPDISDNAAAPAQRYIAA